MNRNGAKYPHQIKITRKKNYNIIRLVIVTIDGKPQKQTRKKRPKADFYVRTNTIYDLCALVLELAHLCCMHFKAERMINTHTHTHT